MRQELPAQLLRGLPVVLGELRLTHRAAGCVQPRLQPERQRLQWLSERLLRSEPVVQRELRDLRLLHRPARELLADFRSELQRLRRLPERLLHVEYVVQRELRDVRRLDR